MATHHASKTGAPRALSLFSALLAHHRFVRATGVAVVLFALVAAALPVTLAGIPSPIDSVPCYGVPPMTPIDLRTGNTGGTEDTYGAPDDTWTVTSSPVGASAAFSTPKYPTWVADPAGTNWITPTLGHDPVTGALSAGGSALAPAGLYNYSTTFSLNFASYTNFQLSIKHAADNDVEFFLNSNSIGSGPSPLGFSALTPLSYAGPWFQAGVNTLEARVTNLGQWTGLLVDGQITGECRDPDHPCEPYSFDLRTGNTGGTEDAYGQADDTWTVTSSPIGPSAAFNTPKHPAWVADPTGTNWITPTLGHDPVTGALSAGGSALAPAGIYVYETTFNLDFTTYVNFQISIKHAADNGVTFFLNGFQIGLSGPAPHGFSALTPLTYSGGLFQNGPNVLQAKVANQGQWTGLLVVGEVTGHCRQPCDGPLKHDLRTGNTGGTEDAYGTADDSWTVTSSPVGPSAAFSIPKHAAWVADPAGTNWITPTAEDDLTGGLPLAAGGSALAPAGTYVYATTFSLDFGAHTGFQLGLNHAADNGVTFFLNTNAIGSGPFPNGFTTLTSLSYAGPAFQPGMNTLEARVTNAGSWTALLVDGFLRAECVPPPPHEGTA